MPSRLLETLRAKQRGMRRVGVSRLPRMQSEGVKTCECLVTED